MGPRTAADALEQMFGGGGHGKRAHAAPRRPTVVLVDEMDLLINKAQVGRQPARGMGRG